MSRFNDVDLDAIYDRIPQLRLSEKLHKARKHHQCSTCPRTISPGEAYWASFWLVDGSPYYEKKCKYCPPW